MKLSSKPCHYAPRWTGMNNKNTRGHRSFRGEKAPSRKKNLAMEFVRMMFGSMSRRTRRVFMEQKRALKK